MTRFEMEISGKLGAFWKKNAEDEVKKAVEQADREADLCGMERRKVLHYLYKTLQEDLGVTLNPYLAVMKSEGGDESICNLHVIASVERFYKKAVEMNQDVIERKKIFG